MSLLRYCVYAGRSWQEKLEDVRSEMKKKAASVLVVTALDEVACKTITIIIIMCLGQRGGQSM